MTNKLPHYKNAHMFQMSYVHSGMNRIRLTPLKMEEMFGVKVYLHQFIGRDIDDSCHDHPWKSFSVLLNGDMVETQLIVTKRLDGFTIQGYEKAEKVTRFKYRPANYIHKLSDGSWKRGIFPWTLFITWGPSRTWGFWEKTKNPKEYRFIDYKRYLRNG